MDEYISTRTSRNLGTSTSQVLEYRTYFQEIRTWIQEKGVAVQLFRLFWRRLKKVEIFCERMGDGKPCVTLKCKHRGSTVVRIFGSNTLTMTSSMIINQIALIFTNVTPLCRAHGNSHDVCMFGPHNMQQQQRWPATPLRGHLLRPLTCSHSPCRP